MRATDPMTALDRLDAAILVVSDDLKDVYLSNNRARALRLGVDLLNQLRESGGRRSGVYKIQGVTYFLRVESLGGVQPPAKILVVYTRAQWEPDLFRRLEMEQGITHKEFLVAKLVRDGRSNSEIAQTLGISRAAVKRRMEALFRKLGVNCRTALVDVIAHR